LRRSVASRSLSNRPDQVLRRRCDLLGIDPQGIAQILQESSHRRRADWMADRFQPIAQAAQTTAHPDLSRHRVTSRLGLYQLLECGDDRYILFFSVAGRPAPGWRTRSTGRSTREAANSSRPRRMVFSSTPVMQPPHCRAAATQAPDTNAAGLHQATQQHVHLMMPLPLGMVFTPPARTALAGMNHLSWHSLVRHRPLDVRTLPEQPHHTGVPKNRK
jgi:hypothetical protein